MRGNGEDFDFGEALLRHDNTPLKTGRMLPWACGRMMGLGVERRGHGRRTNDYRSPTGQKIERQINDADCCIEILAFGKTVNENDSCCIAGVGRAFSAGLRAGHKVAHDR